jgi:hypothetical protein
MARCRRTNKHDSSGSILGLDPARTVLFSLVATAERVGHRGPGGRDDSAKDRQSPDPERQDK